MKICFIGNCGHTGQALKYLKTREDAELCGMAPWSADEGMTKSCDPAIPFYSDCIQMLDQVCPDLAVVSPVFGLTGQAILACAKRGINVFAEKPIASSLAELETVREAVRTSGIKFCAMHYLRYAPAFYHGARMVKDGEIGDLRMITAQKSYKYGTRPAWYGNRTLYGGTIPWVGIHAIDWVYHFAGKRFLSVSAQSFGRDPELAALCRFEMENGLMASVNIDYYRPDTAPTHDDDRIRCVGTDGILEVRDGKILLMNQKGCFEMTPGEAPELLEEFLDGREVLDAEEIFYLTRGTLCARDAADRGITMKIED